MTAKEYANKYRERFNNANNTLELAKPISDLLNELLGEMREVVRIRSIKSKEGLKSLIKEFNIKANKINALLGNSLIKNWFTDALDYEFIPLHIIA